MTPLNAAILDDPVFNSMSFTAKLLLVHFMRQEIALVPRLWTRPRFVGAATYDRSSNELRECLDALRPYVGKRTTLRPARRAQIFDLAKERSRRRSAA